MKRHFANMVFALILAAYTVYAALDTFVIVRVLTPDTLPTATAEASAAPTEAPTAAPTATESPAEQATTTPISTDTDNHERVQRRINRGCCQNQSKHHVCEMPLHGS